MTNTLYEKDIVSLIGTAKGLYVFGQRVASVSVTDTDATLHTTKFKVVAAFTTLEDGGPHRNPTYSMLGYVLKSLAAGSSDPVDIPEKGWEWVGTRKELVFFLRSQGNVVAHNGSVITVDMDGIDFNVDINKVVMDRGQFMIHLGGVQTVLSAEGADAPNLILPWLEYRQSLP